MFSSLFFVRLGESIAPLGPTDYSRSLFVWLLLLLLMLFLSVTAFSVLEGHEGAAAIRCFQLQRHRRRRQLCWDERGRPWVGLGRGRRRRGGRGVNGHDMSLLVSVEEGVGLPLELHGIVSLPQCLLMLAACIAFIRTGLVDKSQLDVFAFRVGERLHCFAQLRSAEKERRGVGSGATHTNL